MKKIIFICTLIMVMAMSGLAFASDSEDLAREQQSVDVLVSVVEAKNVPEYKAFSKLLSTDLRANFSEQEYGNLQKIIADKYGDMKDVKFYSFQRFDQADRLTYIVSFTKQQAVAMNVNFDKNKRIVDFSFEPLAVNNGDNAQPSESK